MKKRDKSPLKYHIPLPRGYIGESILNHPIPFLKWANYPRLFNYLFEKKYLNSVKECYSLDDLNNGNKTILLISDDAREPICGIPQDQLLKNLNIKYNIIVIYIRESVENIIKNNKVSKIGPINEDVRKYIYYHLHYLISKNQLDLCLMIEPMQEYILVPWIFKIPLINIVSNQYYTAKKREELKICAGYSDYQVQYHRIATPSLGSKSTPSNKIISLLASYEKADEVPVESRFERFQDTLSSLMIKCIKKKLSDSENAKIISESVFFDENFCLPRIPGKKNDLSTEYLRLYSSNIEPRKPIPGFNPAIYAQSHPDLTGDPLVHFIKNNYPRGKWLQEVLQPGKHNKIKTDESIHSRVALHIHIHYIDDLSSLIKRIKKNKLRPDIYISTTSLETKEKIKSIFLCSGISLKEILVYTNKGRNIAPFLTGILPRIQHQYEIVGHVHLKKSLHSGVNIVKNWNEFLFENIIGGRKAMLDQIIAEMLMDKSIGIVYPDDPNLYDWRGNYNFAHDLSLKMGISIPDEHEKFNFPAGAMFWIRPSSFQPLMDLNLRWEDYPEEPAHVDGTMLHGLERLFGVIPEKTGYRTVVTHVPGISRICGVYDL